MSSLVNGVLFLALVLTSVIVVTLYLKLKKLDAYHAEYKLVFDQTAEALGSAREAVRSFSTEGRELLEALSARIDEARAVLVELEAATAEAGPHSGEASSQRSAVAQASSAGPR